VSEASLIIGIERERGREEERLRKEEQMNPRETYIIQKTYASYTSKYPRDI